MSTRPDHIDPEIAWEYFGELRVTFVDARPPAAWAEHPERLPGAVHIRPGSGAEMDAVLEALPREKLIIVYGDGAVDEPEEAASVHVARRARELGRGDASVLAGGLRAWKAAGLPTERTAEEPTAERLLEGLSLTELDKLCRVAFWRRLGSTPLRAWNPSRASMEAYLAPLSRELIEQFHAFLHVEEHVRVPDEHTVKVVNLPPDVRERAASLFWTQFGHAPVDDELTRLIDDAEATLLLRWFTWAGDIPRHVAWWASYDERAPV